MYVEAQVGGVACRSQGKGSAQSVSPRHVNPGQPQLQVAVHVASGSVMVNVWVLGMVFPGLSVTVTVRVAGDKTDSCVVDGMEDSVRDGIGEVEPLYSHNIC